MTGFILRAACRGRRPSSQDSSEGRERPAISSSLLKDRAVARCLVAPSGYGKTAAALEYGETIHAWKHAFWVNAQSPCFLRDLDARCIAESCFDVDPQASLVVFDDVPVLDAGRAEALSYEIDRLLEKGCEAIVTCTPMADVLGGLQRDRIRVGSEELLLNDDELDLTRPPDERMRAPADTVRAPQRVAALAWGRVPGGRAAFAADTLGEEMPADLLLVLASAYVMGSGPLSDLLGVVSLQGGQVAELVEEYPHVLIDLEAGTFEAPVLALDDLVTPLRKHMSALVQRSSCESPDELVGIWAERLMTAGRESRACEVAGSLLPKLRRVAWLLGHARELARCACFLPMLHLAQNGRTCRDDTKWRSLAIEALCRRLLGDAQGALSCAKRGGLNPAVPDDARICCLLVAARLGDSVLSRKAVEELGGLLGREEPRGAQVDSMWYALAEARVAAARGSHGLAEWWRAASSRGEHDDVLAIAASWLFALLEGTPRDGSAPVAPELAEPERYVRTRMHLLQPGGSDFFVASAALSLEEAHVRGIAYDGGPLEAAALMWMRNAEMVMLVQRQQFQDEQAALDLKRADWAATHPDSLLTQERYVAQTTVERNVPMLSLKMFGRFEVTIGGQIVAQSRFRRQNTRSLLVLLAANQGREVPRETLAKSLWPNASEDTARKNFYSVWSDLRHAVSLPDGTCPYLLRHQFGCSLEMRYVRSDVEELEGICRELLFGVPNVERWSQLYAKVDSEFASDLMPSDTKNVLVARARNEYRNKLVDALVAATASITDTDTPQWGIWFARAALKHDETREDAYVVLMRAQIASNQRTAAMATYLKCRRVLSEQLGIDPSPETTALYESLLDSD